MGYSLLRRRHTLHHWGQSLIRLVRTCYYYFLYYFYCSGSGGDIVVVVVVVVVLLLRYRHIWDIYQYILYACHTACVHSKPTVLSSSSYCFLISSLLLLLLLLLLFDQYFFMRCICTVCIPWDVCVVIFFFFLLISWTTHSLNRVTNDSPEKVWRSRPRYP